MCFSAAKSRPNGGSRNPGRLKVCVDVVEAVLRSAYTEFGTKPSLEVAEEIGISLPRDKKETDKQEPRPAVPPKQNSTKLSETLLHWHEFHHLALLLKGIDRLYKFEMKTIVKNYIFKIRPRKST